MALPRGRAILLAFFLAMAASSTQTAAGDEAATPSSGTESATSPPQTFLSARCATTLYPDVCYDSLLPYASTFQGSHVKLARAAADVAGAHLRAFSARIKELRGGGYSGGGDNSPRVDAALQDCASTISSAKNLARRSSAELHRLDAAAPGSRQARWLASNVKTWLSAAITSEGTCADGFEEAGEPTAAAESPAGKEVAAGVVSVKQHTSIALALVNGIPL